MASAPRGIDTPSSILVLVLVAAVTEAMFLVLPSFVGALADVLHLSPQRTGLLGSADLAGIALATATAPRWMRRARWRRVTMGSLAAFLVLNALCVGVTQFIPLLGLRFLAGLAAGAAYAVALAGIVDTRKADRNAAFMVCMQVVFSAVGVYALDAVPIPWRLNAVYDYILVWLVPTIVLAARYGPEDPGDRPPGGGLDWRRLGLPGVAAVAGAGLYFLMIGAVWGYLEGIARQAGLSLEQTGTALSLGLMVSLIGSFAAAWLGVRYGRVVPLVVTAAFQLTCLYLLTRLRGYPAPVLAFYLINAVFQVFWSYVIAYFITIFNDVDSTGRFVALYGTSAHLTLAVGPYVGALLIAGNDHTLLLWFGLVVLSLCYASFLTAVWAGRRSPGATAVRGGG